MNIEEIRKEAPEGATHYSETPVEIIFLKESYKYGWKCYAFGEWHPYDESQDEEIKPLN